MTKRELYHSLAYVKMDVPLFLAVAGERFPCEDGYYDATNEPRKATQMILGEGDKEESV